MNILQESNISHLQTLLRAPSHKVNMWRQRRRRRGLQVPTEGRPLPPLSLPWVPVSCPQRCHCGAHEDLSPRELHKDSLPSTSAEENPMRSQGSDDNLFIESLIRSHLLDSMAVGIFGVWRGILVWLPASEAAALP